MAFPFERMLSDPANSRCAVLPTDYNGWEYANEFPLGREDHQALVGINGTHVACRMPSVKKVFPHLKNSAYKSIAAEMEAKVWFSRDAGRTWDDEGIVFHYMRELVAMGIKSADQLNGPTVYNA